MGPKDSFQDRMEASENLAILRHEEELLLKLLTLEAEAQQTKEQLFGRNDKLTDPKDLEREQRLLIEEFENRFGELRMPPSPATAVDAVAMANAFAESRRRAMVQSSPPPSQSSSQPSATSFLNQYGRPRGGTFSSSSSKQQSSPADLKAVYRKERDELERRISELDKELAKH